MPSRPSSLPTYLSLAEAAETCGVSTRTVRRYIADGRLDAVRLGPRLIRVSEESLAGLLRAA